MPKRKPKMPKLVVGRIVDVDAFDPKIVWIMPFKKSKKKLKKVM